MERNSSSFILRLSAWLTLSLAGYALAGGQTNISPDRVTFFSEPNFRGEALTVEAGASIETLDRYTRSDKQPWTFGISSVRIEGAARATVFTAPGFGGERLEIAASIPDLYTATRSTENGSTWDRCIVSLAVTGPQRVSAPPPPDRLAPPPTTVYVVPAPTRPPPVVVMRPRYDQRTADALIQQAFREVLGRAADPDGLRHYRELLMREGWTDRQLIEDLQRSKEARSISPDDAITRAYREVLGRDPDLNGLNHYRQLWRAGWTQGQIRDDLRRSTESRGNTSRSTITKVYRELLGREPDTEGYATYERLMREKGMSERELRNIIMSGDEYRQSHPRR